MFLVNIQNIFAWLTTTVVVAMHFLFVKMSNKICKFHLPRLFRYTLLKLYSLLE